MTLVTFLAVFLDYRKLANTIKENHCCESKQIKWGKIELEEKGKSWNNPIEMNLIYSLSSPSSSFGYFPDGTKEVWYSFRPLYNKGVLYAHDKTFNSDHSGDIVVDVYGKSSSDSDIFELEINGITVKDINIGKGPNDLNNISASNWTSFGLNTTFYVRVRPRLGSEQNKGTFRLFFQYC